MTTVTHSEIESAKLVEIRWDYFCATGDNTCDWFPYRSIFHVLDDEQLTDLTARNPTEARESVAVADPCVIHPQTLMDSLVTYITRKLLKLSYLDFIHDRYSSYDNGHIRWRDIKVLGD